MQKGAASLDRIDEVLKDELTVRGAEINPNSSSRRIAVRSRVTSISRASAPALDGFELQVSKGETVALVGASGSGKTTVARLLLRLYDPGQGHVRVDETDVRDFRTETFGATSVVSQDPLLFNDTVEANIALFDPERMSASPP